jgi:hypothetical protein
MPIEGAPDKAARANVIVPACVLLNVWMADPPGSSVPVKVSVLRFGDGGVVLLLQAHALNASDVTSTI